MLQRIRHLPGLRSRSNVEMGIFLAVLVVLSFAAFFSVTSAHIAENPHDALLAGLAGVGGTVFVAYTVGMSGLFRDLRRGSETETLLGFLVGLGMSGVLGVGLSLLLIDTARPLHWLGRFAFFWAAASLIFLAALVAALPLFAYEDARAKHLNRDD